VMFGVMQEAVPASGVQALLAGRPPVSMPDSRSSGMREARCVSAESTAGLSPRSLGCGLAYRSESEKATPWVASLGDFAKSPIATTRGATPSFLHVCRIEPTASASLDGLRSHPRAVQGGGGSNDNLT